MQNTLLVYCSCPDPETARNLANGLVGDRLAACVSIIPAVTSVYEWQGAVQNDPENLLLIKTSTERYGAMETALRERHPYELPEIIAVPIDRGLPAYLNWVRECTLADD
jgi:periplasmic divalent cation tolerance protein